MSDLLKQRANLRDTDNGSKGALLEGVHSDSSGAHAAADVVLAIVSEMGKAEVRAATAYDGGLKNRAIEEECRIRVKALSDLAGHLGIKHAVKVVYDQPIVEGDSYRVMDAPTDIEDDPRAVAAQAAIIGAVDNGYLGSVSVNMPGRGKSLEVHAGGIGIDSALDDFEDV